MLLIFMLEYNMLLIFLLYDNCVLHILYVSNIDNNLMYGYICTQYLYFFRQSPPVNPASTFAPQSYGWFSSIWIMPICSL